MNAGVPAPADVRVLDAPAHWRCIDFCSDLHLQASEPTTLAAFADYLRGSVADAIFVLGDLFEVWVGDDTLEDINQAAGQTAQAVAAMLLQASRTRALYFVTGNRDFLFGSAAAQRCALTLLPDPTALQLPSERVLLSHGDALCLDDVAYQRFRAQVRQAEWQRNFLAQPLPARWQQARAMRAESTAMQKAAHEYPDVDAGAALAWLQAAEATRLIHGHTHRPAEHDLPAERGQRLSRSVLSDWDASAHPPRLEVLRWRGGAWSRIHPDAAARN